MKCRVCRARPVIEVRRHNAAFCRPHFFDHLHRQVERAIHDYQMIAPDDRLLLGVSGGKDSLALWDILTDMGYRVDGVYLALGIGENDGYSFASQELAEDYARNRGLKLRVVDLAIEYGYTIPEAARQTGRVPCSVCGLSKRYILNQVAHESGYTTLVMGHNLDDEAAVLMGNVLNWDLEYMGRQQPVLPATEHGLVKKIKPLLRIAEREAAAYCVLKGIEYEVDECPMVAGNTGNRIKEWLTEIEDQRPGTKSKFLFGFMERAAAAYVDTHKRQVELQPCDACSQPTTNTTCAFCRLQVRMTGG